MDHKLKYLGAKQVSEIGNLSEMVGTGEVKGRDNALH